jgi:transglutaminase-like putative cysteine protease
MNNREQIKWKTGFGLILFIFFCSNSFAADFITYTKPNKYHVRQTGCTYNKNITTMTHLELNVPLPENWPDCNVSDVNVSGDDPFFLHNTEGPGQIYRTVYKNGLPRKGTIAFVRVEYDVKLYEVNINFDVLSKQTYPAYIKNSEYEYYTRTSDTILNENPDVKAIIEQLGQNTNRHPILYTKAVYDWIAQNIKYADPRPSADLSVCLKERKGDCGAIAAFFVEFCRHTGIPTRFIAGCWAGGFDGWHCWAEFKVPGVGWIPIDHSPAGGYGHLSNNHLPLVKAGEMKFNVEENKGSKDCGFVQVGYWYFFYAGGSEGKRLDTEFSVESFAYRDMPQINNQQDIKQAFQTANECFNKKDYDQAIRIYRYIASSKYFQNKDYELIEYKLAKCFFEKKQRIKAALELMPLINKPDDSGPAKNIKDLLRSIRKEELYIDELNLSNIQQGWGQPHNNQSVEGKPISIGGKIYKRGIGTHAGSLCYFDANDSIEEFSANVGVDDEVGSGRGSVEFFVIGDGKILWQSGIMKGGEPAKPVKVATKNVKKLLLKVSDANDGAVGDHADWADAKLIITGIYPTIVPAESR